MNKPKNLKSYITFEEIEQIGFIYTQNPFPWVKEKRKGDSEQFFMRKDGEFLINLNVGNSQNCVIWSVGGGEECDCHIYFRGTVHTIWELKDVLVYCGIAHSRKNW